MIRFEGSTPRRDLRARAQRVLDGSQTGTYTKRMMARDILAMCDLLEAWEAVAEAAGRIDVEFIEQAIATPTSDYVIAPEDETLLKALHDLVAALARLAEAEKAQT